MRLWLLLLGISLSAFAQQGGWQVGLASVDITPGEPVPMAGYASRRAPFEAVEQPLHAKAMALQDANGKRALLITADILGFTEERSQRIADRLKQSDGINREEILLNASHTHSGPLVAGSMLTSVDAESRRKLEDYIGQLEDQVTSVGQEALRNLQPAKLSWGQGVAKFVMNRREFTDRGIILGTNGRGPTDRTVPVLRIDSPAGKLRGIVFGAATHCTTLTGGNMRISGDYAGFAQQYIETREPGVQAMFMTGCAGDANPNPRGTFDLARRHGSDLADEVMRVLQGDLFVVEGALNTQFARIELPLQKHSRQQIESMGQDAPSYRRFYTEGALEKLGAGEQLLQTYSAPFALWRLGNLTLVAFSGETLVGYTLATERLLGPLRLWVSGYNNDVFGYLATKQVIEEGGYESRGLYVDYGLFDTSVEQTVMSAIKAMAIAAGLEVR